MALAGLTAVEILLGEQGEVSAVRYRPRAGGEDTVAHAPVVVANASPYAVENMLPAGERGSFMAPYRDKPLSTSLFSISLGLNQRPSELGLSAYSTMIVPEWMERLSDFKHCAGLFTDMPSGRLPVLGVCDYSHIARDNPNLSCNTLLAISASTLCSDLLPGNWTVCSF